VKHNPNARIWSAMSGHDPIVAMHKRLKACQAIPWPAHDPSARVWSEMLARIQVAELLTEPGGCQANHTAAQNQAPIPAICRKAGIMSVDRPIATRRAGRATILRHCRYHTATTC